MSYQLLALSSKLSVISYQLSAFTPLRFPNPQSLTPNPHYVKNNCDYRKRASRSR
jgi:hypothetical protein